MHKEGVRGLDSMTLPRLNQLSILIIFKEFTKTFRIRQLELGKLMFSLNHSLLPSKFNIYFSLNKQVHSYATDTRTI